MKDTYLKDAYYFSHDSNAKDDPKCVELIEALGLEGYGIFWVLVETLRDQPNYKYPLKSVPGLARRYNTSTEKMRVVINTYGLFEIDNEHFFSLSLMERMKKMDAKREQARSAGIASAQKRSQRKLNGSSTDVQLMLSDSSTSVEPVKESKVKENSSPNCYQVYEQNIGLLKPAIVQSIDYFLQDKIEDALISEVIDYAVKQGKRNWAYIEKIINSNSENGIKTLEQYKAMRKERTPVKQNAKPILDTSKEYEGWQL